MMLQLAQTLQQWPSDSFSSALKHALETLPAGSLPLELGTSRCGLVDDSDISVTVIDIRDAVTCISAKVGIFFSEIVAGCVCGDEPTPELAYCEMLITIDKTTGAATIEVISV